MTGDCVSPASEKISVKSRNNPFEGAFFELANFDLRNITSSENDKFTPQNSNPQSSGMFSTTDLISAVEYAWHCAKKPLSVLLAQTNSKCKYEVIQEGGTLHYFTDGRTFRASTSADDQPCSHYFHTKEKLEHFRVDQKTSCFQPSYKTFSFWRIVQTRSTMIDESFIDNCISSTGIPINLGSIYGWMSEIALPKQNNQVNSVKIESNGTRKCYTGSRSSNSGSGFVPADTTHTFNYATTGIATTGISAFQPEAAETLDLSFKEAANSDLKAPTSVCSEDEFVHDQHIEATDCEIFTSRCDVEFQDTDLTASSHDCEDSIKESGNDLHENQKDLGTTFVEADSSEVKSSLLVKEKHQYALAKQEHAFAGAMAGIFVSLCLHPMDTIKTVIQSCRADQKPLHTIGRSIIAERGIPIAITLGTLRKYIFH